MYTHDQERLAHALALEVGVVNKPLSQLKKGEKEQLLTALTAWELPIKVSINPRGSGTCHYQAVALFDSIGCWSLRLADGLCLHVLLRT